MPAQWLPAQHGPPSTPHAVHCPPAHNRAPVQGVAVGQHGVPITPQAVHTPTLHESPDAQGSPTLQQGPPAAPHAVTVAVSVGTGMSGSARVSVGEGMSVTGWMSKPTMSVGINGRSPERPASLGVPLELLQPTEKTIKSPENIAIGARIARVWQRFAPAGTGCARIKG